MAFVYRSLKNLEEPIKPNNNLNYYENLNLLTELFEKYSNNRNSKNKSKISFGSKSVRNSLNFIDGSNSPGPGSYKLSKSFIKSTFNYNVTSPNDPEGLEGEPSQLFISKDKRFKNLKNSNIDNPSPGYYFADKNNYEPKNLHQYISHLKNFGVYNPFSSKRQISIPTNDLYYEVKDDGGIEVKTNLEEMKNIRNKLGPGSYDIKFNKKNNSIDWSKTKKDLKQKEPETNENNDKKDKKILKNLNINTNISYDESTLPFESTFQDKTNNSTNLLTYNMERFADKICNTEILSQKEKNKKNEIVKGENFPGPGDYNITFNRDAPVNFSNVNNFGSNSSRGLLYPNTKHKIQIGLKNKKSSLIIKNGIKKKKYINNLTNNSFSSETENEGAKLNKENNSYRLHSLHVNSIKEQYINNKNSMISNLGPGTYNPTLSSDLNKKENHIQNFNSLEKRFKINNKETLMVPGVGTYSTLDTYHKNKSNFKSMVPSNIRRRNYYGISAEKIERTKDEIYLDNHRYPHVGEYFPELRNSIEYNVMKNLNNMNKKPCFNYGEKRFFEPKRKYEDENQVGKYNLRQKDKEFEQKVIPFSSNVERNGNFLFISKENANKKNLGPGTYRNNSYFDWNKKSYNILFA